MDRLTAIFVDGLGAAAAASGILTQLEGRIFALLYLTGSPMSLDEIADELQQSKSNISVTIRSAVEWHLVRRVPVAGSRKDHYEAATDFYRIMQEIMERRFRWMVRQVVATVDDTKRISAELRPRSAHERKRAASVGERLDAVRAFFGAVDQGITTMTRGGGFAPENVVSLPQRSDG